MKNKKPSIRPIERRILKLNEQAAALVNKKLSGIYYQDGTDHQGRAHFLDDQSSKRHELMQGVDLVTEDGTTVGFYWEWFNDYELGIALDGIKPIINNNNDRFDVSEHPHWSKWIGKTISQVTVFKDQHGYVYDSRIDFFDDADPIWICARQINDYLSNGDDIIIVFCKDEAKRLGLEHNK